jgi:hypothetical protein
MNKFILCAMDKSKTIEELEKNATDADDAAKAAHAAAAAAADAAKAAHAVDAAAYWIGRYFERTGENSGDYENKIKEK